MPVKIRNKHKIKVSTQKIKNKEPRLQRAVKERKVRDWKCISGY